MKQILIPVLALMLLSCKKDSETTAETTDDLADGTTTSDFTVLYEKMYNITSIDYSGSEVVIKTDDLPDHKTPFYGSGHAKYEAYNGDNPDFSTSINLGGTVSDPVLEDQNLTFRIPKNPVKSSTHSATSGGPIGIARNGVTFFNQYNGMNVLLDDLEMNNADQYLGHPTPTAAGGQYHYHYEPKYLTATYGDSSFMGFLLDGFPVYGPYENGVKVTTAMLDEYNGHVSSTPDFPNDKIYHYHIISAPSNVPSSLSQAAPWINGGAYYGKKGTVN